MNGFDRLNHQNMGGLLLLYQHYKHSSKQCLGHCLQTLRCVQVLQWMLQTKTVALRFLVMACGSAYILNCAMIKTWIASRLKLPRSEVGGWCLPIEPWSSHMDLWPRSWSTFVHLRPFALATNGFRVSWRIWPWSRWVSYLLSWLAVLTLAIPWWEMEFCRLAWHMDAAHLISPIDTCWRSPLISGLVQLI